MRNLTNCTEQMTDTGLAGPEQGEVRAQRRRRAVRRPRIYFVRRAVKLSRPHPAPGDCAPPEWPPGALTYMHMNVRGMGNKFMKVYGLMKAGGWHMCVLTEAHCVSGEQAQEWARQAGWEGDIFCSADRERPAAYAGVLILVRRGAPISGLRMTPGDEVPGRALLIEFDFDVYPCALVGAYGYTRPDLREAFFLHKLQPLIDRVRERTSGVELVVCGDMNCIKGWCDVLCDSDASRKRRLVGALEGLVPLMADCELWDALREAWPWARAVIYICPYSAAHLDYFLVSRFLVGRLLRPYVAVRTDLRVADHYAITMALAAGDQGPAAVRPGHERALPITDYPGFAVRRKDT